jgi:hypothetical protein
MLVGAIIGFGIGYIIYRRTMARAAELAREDEHAHHHHNGAAAEEGQAGGFYDSEPTMMDPEDAAELLNDDDMSMWETQVDEYRDEEDDSAKGTSQNVRR